MSTKREELQAAMRGEGCLGKAGTEEPIFVLRAMDRCAPKIVRAWADFAASQSGASIKTETARALADQMEEYARENGGAKWPD